MTPAERDLLGAWLALAEEDLGAAELVLERDPPFLRTALFHAQQAAEKALKGALASAGTAPPRTHDVVLLLDLCLPERGDLDAVREDALWLKPYAVAPRYLELDEEYTREEAAEALEAARRIVEAVRGKR